MSAAQLILRQRWKQQNRASVIGSARQDAASVNTGVLRDISRRSRFRLEYSYDTAGVGPREPAVVSRVGHIITGVGGSGARSPPTATKRGQPPEGGVVVRGVV